MNSETAAITTEQMNAQRERFTAGDLARLIIKCVGAWVRKCLVKCDYEVPDEEKLKGDPQYGTCMATLETDAISSEMKYVKIGDVIGVSREGIPIRVMD